ncbi:ammonium transporter [Brevundimonas subvibrioides]|uniref:ammonium transporter n=1 Tax=Brevundimonas subvibrioides TaxID=74313 RepID=UPI0022B44B0F|nr:ammonium transporter [Brevundimonas subvibrioides]
MNKDLINSLAWGGGVVVLALCASLARHQGYIDQDTTLRIVLGGTGLMIVSFGNRIPKTFTPGAGARKAQRVAGWSMVLSGLIYAGAFVFAPLSTAVLIGCGAVIAGIAVTFGYCLSLRARAI